MKMNSEELEESIKKYYQDKMKNHSKKESPIYVDLDQLIKEKENE